MDGFRRIRVDARLIGWSQPERGRCAPQLLRGSLFTCGGAGRAARRWLRRADYVIVHYPSLIHLDQIESLVGHGSVVVWSLEHPESPTQGTDEFRERAVARAMASAAGVVVMSAETADYWVNRGLDPTRTKVVVTALPQSQERRPRKAGGHSALYSGNFGNPEVLDLPEMASIVRRRIPDFVLHMYGDASGSQFDAMRERLAQLGASDYVILHKPVDRLRLARLQRQTDVLISFQGAWLRSRAGFPSKVGEYLDSGTPTVCSDVAPLSGIAIDGVTAFVAPAGDIAAHAERIIYALEHHHVASVVGKMGRERIRSIADSALVADDLLTWLKTLRQ